MNVEKNVSISNAFGLDVKASFLVNPNSKRDILETINFAKEKGLPVLVIGDATNMILPKVINSVVIVFNTKKIKMVGNLLEIDAGRNWDELVAFAVKNNLSGIESLPAIPGTVGAAPVQNIGAYGTEIGEKIVSVEVFDKKKNDFVLIEQKDCGFGYRDSLFKREKDRFIINKIIFKLSKEKPQIPKYKDVENYFKAKNLVQPSLLEIRKAIIEIRKNKLPDLKIIPNCGSFFKNPFIDLKKSNELKRQYPDIPIFPFGKMIKTSAGFLIEQAGFKGKTIGKIKVYDKNALVLTNPNKADFADVILAKETIQKAVFQKFGIELEPEVNIIK